jgi:hypothetical protein
MEINSGDLFFSRQAAMGSALISFHHLVFRHRPNLSGGTDAMSTDRLSGTFIYPGQKAAQVCVDL